MLNNYGKLAWRHLAKGRLHSTINIAGLAIGMAVSFTLLLYVQNEYSFDTVNTNYRSLYQVFRNQPTNGELRTRPNSPEPLAAALQKDFPEISNTVRVNSLGNSLISYQDKAIKLPAIAADASLPDLFTLEFLSGDPSTALKGQSAIVLTQSAATAIFGNAANAAGKTVKLNNQFPLTVTAVVKDLPANSTLSFKAILPWESYTAEQPWIKDAGWGNYFMDTWVLLKPGASLSAVNDKIKNLVGRYAPDDKFMKLFLYPLDRIHLYNEFKNGLNTGGRIEYVRLFLLLAIGILLIACINFMNLSTARSEKRAREVGVRKTMGAHRVSLIKQFLVESLLMASLAFILAVLLTAALLPLFDQVAGVPLSLPYDNPIAWCLALGITAITGLLAGSYPALFLSSFTPVKVLKGQLTKPGATAGPRRLLVISQFAFAIGLIVSSIFIYKQISYIRDRPIGYDRNGLVEIPLDGKLDAMFDSFRHDAIASGAVTDAAMTSESIANNQSATWDVRWPDQHPGEDKIPIDCMAVTYHFLDTYSLQLALGRDFDPARPADSTAVILNEAAIRLMRLKSPLGRQITWQGIPRTVIGVVKDFVLRSPFEPVKPAIIGFQKDWVGNIGLRLQPNAPVSKSMAALQAVYKKYNPEYPFEYRFTDERFAKKFANEKLLGTIALSFTTLAIFISCLGLFGLASFSAEQRRKEIGIRKVLGATTANLWFNLSREFLQGVVIAFVIGSAGSGYYIHRWLAGYTYHTTLDGWVFLVTLLLSIAICLAAVSWQAIKAATANPVTSLRND